MMKRILVLIFPLALLVSCSSNGSDAERKEVFVRVDTNFRTTALIVPEGGFTMKVMYRAGEDEVGPDGKTIGPSKDKHDFMAFVPIEGAEDHGLLWVNHESMRPHPFGDGGGATVIEVLKESESSWKVIGMPKAIDFSPVGGTIANCLGALTPWNTVLTSEEMEPESNYRLHNSDSIYLIQNMDSVGGWDRYKNYGWMVEVDPFTRKAIRKNYAMGRFMHEGALCMKDMKTVYLMDDNGPGCIFKFVADKEGDYSAGQLYAYRQSADLNSGDWLALPRDRDSLFFARKMAYKRGATIFIRPEDIEMDKNGNFLITETGLDSTYLGDAITLGGKVAKHLEKYHIGDSIYDDKFGRILKFDPNTNKLSVFLESGAAKEDHSIHLSNPDNLSIDLKRNMLYIHEDLVGTSHGRVPAYIGNVLFNEIYALDLDIANPTLDDLQRFAVGPRGSETTGPVWSPDFSTLFFNLQHPDPTNPEPFNKALTVMVMGFKD